jgi:hypothetical protein
MPGTDLMSLLLGAAVGFLASLVGFRIRHQWERFDADKQQCRTELIELARSAEQARIAVRGARLREGIMVATPTAPEAADQVLTHYAAVAETVFEFRSRTRRLKPGPLRMASAGYALLLSTYHLGGEDPPSTDELDSAGVVVRELIAEAIDRVDRAHGAVFALRGEPLCCPPSPYSSPLPLSRS